MDDKYTAYMHICYGKVLLSLRYEVCDILYKSPLPLTDPRDAVTRAHRVVHRCRRSETVTSLPH